MVGGGGERPMSSDHVHFKDGGKRVVIHTYFVRREGKKKDDHEGAARRKTQSKCPPAKSCTGWVGPTLSQQQQSSPSTQNGKHTHTHVKSTGRRATPSLQTPFRQPTRKALYPAGTPKKEGPNIKHTPIFLTHIKRHEYTYTHTHTPGSTGTCRV